MMDDFENKIGYDSGNSLHLHLREEAVTAFPMLRIRAKELEEEAAAPALEA